jgi:hypothetical protein
MLNGAVGRLLTALILTLPSVAIAQTAVDKPSTEVSQKIPLTLGLGNFASGDVTALMNEDRAALSPLFQRTLTDQAPRLSGAHVLFLYADLNPDGTLPGTKSGVRRVVELTKAGIVVVAMPVSGESMKATLALPGPKSANLVFTVDRKGAAFPKFFRDLFERMRRGEDMLSAWIELAPQGPVPSQANLPEMFLLPEGGKLAFPPPQPAAR